MTAATADALMAIFGFKRVEGEQMKTDRELLELAAKAAGYEIIPWENPLGFVIRNAEGYPQSWNPLINDGDALRLAARLSLMIDTDYNSHTAVGSASLCEILEGHSGDPLAATRRAIVRAAAAIGEGMQ